MFWIACPAAPLTRLSSTAITSARSVSGGRWTAMRSVFDARTLRVSGSDPARHHVDERLAGIALLVERLQVDVGVLERRVERREDAADHRRQVRREREPHRLAGSRGSVPGRSPADGDGPSTAIGGEVVRRFGERQRQLGLAARAGHARFAVGDQVVACRRALLRRAAGTRAARRSDSSRDCRRCAPCGSLRG